MKKLVTISIMILLVFSSYLFIVAGKWAPVKTVDVYASKIPENETSVFRYSLDWSSDGKYLAIMNAEEEKLTVLDVSSSDIVFTKEYFSSKYLIWMLVKFSPDGKFLLVNAEKELEFFTTDSWSMIKSYSIDGVESASWSSDGKYVAFSNDTGLYIIDTNNWQIKEVNNTLGGMGEIAWSLDGKYLAYATVEYLYILDGNSWKIERTFHIGPYVHFYSLVWSMNSKYLYFSSVDYKDRYLIEKMDTTTGNKLSTFNMKNNTIPYQLSFNYEKGILAVGTTSAFPKEKNYISAVLLDADLLFIEEIEKINVSAGEQPFTHCISVAWSPDGNSLAVGCKDVKVYTTEEGLFGTGTQGEGSEIPLLQIGVGSTMIVVIAASIWYWKKRR